MDLTKLNNYASTYFAHRSGDNFRNLYDEAARLFLGMHRQKVSRDRLGSDHDAVETFDDTLMDISSRHDIGDFGKTLSAALRKKRAMIGRTNRRRQTRYRTVIDEKVERDDGTYTPKYEAKTENKVVEDEVIGNVDKKKEADQRQLIDFLVISDSKEPDATTTDIVEAYRLAPPSAKDTAIAKSLGIHHETVKRKLRRLARRYDANRFGDYRDYLAV